MESNIKTWVDQNRISATPDQIKSIVARFYGETIEIYKDKRRIRDVIKVKHMAMYIIKKRFQRLSDKAIAEMFGLISHCTVISLKNKIEGYLETDKNVARQYEEIQRTINEVETGFGKSFIDTFILGKSIN